MSGLECSNRYTNILRELYAVEVHILNLLLSTNDVHREYLLLKEEE